MRSNELQIHLAKTLAYPSQKLNQEIAEMLGVLEHDTVPNFCGDKKLTEEMLTNATESWFVRWTSTEPKAVCFFTHDEKVYATEPCDDEVMALANALHMILSHQ